MKELREYLEQVPPRTRGDFRGVTGNPHQVLIQQGLPPSSPPLAKGGRVREQRTSARTHEFFHTFRGAGVGCGEPEDPPRRLTPSAPPWRGFSEEPSMPPGGTTKDENHSPFEGGAEGCPMVNMALESRRTPPYAPLDRGDFQRRSAL